MPDKIKCVVSDCKYWQEKFCKASAIEVGVDDGGMVAGAAISTHCHTYEGNK